MAPRLRIGAGKMNRYFNFKPFSKKQRKILNWWCEDSPVNDRDGIIADGAIRSGKTLSMSLSFVQWAMTNFDGYTFAMCGKTIASFRRNVLLWLKLMLKSFKGWTIEDKRSENLVIITHGSVQNSFYIFGGKDEGSQDLIQGLTLAGILFDEAGLMPESFVNQGTGRCSVDGSKFWFNCNPGNPAHWFKKNWIDKAKEKNLLYLHFDMNDNLSLSEKIKERYRSMYSGVFYKRFILGLWVAAEGAVYDQFSNDIESYIIDKLPDDLVCCSVGMDFGGNKSAHAIVCVGITRKFRSVVVIDEYYRKEKISSVQLQRDTAEFLKKCIDRKLPKVGDIYCDSAEQVLIQDIKLEVARQKLPVNVHDARKGSINERIAFYNSLIAQHRFFVMRGCTHVTDALQAAVWDSKKFEDVRLDDGTTNIDSLDAMEYSTEPYLKQIMKAGLYDNR